MPRYLDDTLMDMPALAITRVQLELVSLGKQVEHLVQRSLALVVEGNAQALATLTDDDKAADNLSTSILTYVGQLSDAVHTDDEGRQLVDLARIATCLDAIREVATTSMLALSQRRLAQGTDTASLRSDETAQFAATVIDHLEHAVQTVAHPDADAVSRIVDAKPVIEAQADAARQHIMSVLQLRSQEDAVNFRLANDMIEQFNEVARLSRAITKASRSLNDVRVVAS